MVSSYDYMLLRVLRDSDPVDGKVSTDDIRQARGVSGWPA
jgi:hypothetical protein